MRLMNQVLKPFNEKCVMMYSNDIFVYNKTKKKHLEHLKTIIKSLRANKLY